MPPPDSCSDYQAQPILTGQAEMTGLEGTFLLTLADGQFWTCSRQLHRQMFVGDVHGGTLMYRKSLWQQGRRYPHINLAEDAALVQQVLKHGNRLVRLANPDVFVYIRHSNTAWRFEPGSFLEPSGWQRIPPPAFSQWMRFLLTSFPPELKNSRITEHEVCLVAR